jgi:ferredoxin
MIHEAFYSQSEQRTKTAALNTSQGFISNKTNPETMPTVTFEGHEIECEQGANLRRVLLEAGIKPYNGVMRYANCRGLGTCGTCAVDISRPVSEPTDIEAWRLSFPPHDPESGLRLSCQVSVESDLEVTKHEGLWGHRINPDDKDEGSAETGNEARSDGGADTGSGD